MSTQKLPKITVITVVKEDVEGLAITSKSVLSQDSNNFEWVVVASSTSAESLHQLKVISENVSVRVFHQPARGIYPAMNFAAENARGEWLWFINSGDVFLGNDSISYISGHIGRNSNFGILACAVIQLTNLGYFYSFFIPRIIGEGHSRFANLHHQGSVINRAKFIENGMYDESLELAADGKILDLIISKSNVAFCEKALVGFRLGGRSGQNISKTLHEIDTYRPNNISAAQTRRIIVKNYFRLILLKLENYLPIQFYLHARQKKCLRRFHNTALMSLSSPESNTYRRGIFFELVNQELASHEL